MAIVPLRRMTLIGELQDRDGVIMALQQLGCAHVLDLGETDSHRDRSGADGLRNLANDLKSAIAYLERSAEKRPAPPNTTARGTTSPDQDVKQRDEVKRIIAETLEVESESRLLSEEAEVVRDAIDQTRPWGNFYRPSAEELGGQSLHFYRLTHRQAQAARQAMQGLPAERIHFDQEHEYWLVIAPDPPTGMPCEPQTLDDRSLDELQARLDQIDARREQLQVRRFALTRWIDRLRSHLDEVQDETARMIASHRLLVDGPVFVLDGWVPQRKIEALKEFARENTLALRIRKPTLDDQPPTLLSNPRPIAGAEGAVTFFMTPGYRSWDPTWVMYFSFAAFFAMILADAGYGIVLAGILALAARSLGRTPSGRRFRQLAVFMVAITIGYGLLIGSFFGIAPPDGSLLDRVVIKSEGRSIMEDREAMMLVAATIGVFHLVLANAIVAWRWIGSGHALSSVGWMLALVGGWLLAVAKIPDPDVATLAAGWFGGQAERWNEVTGTAGAWMLGGGLALVFLFSSTRPVLSARPRDWLMRGLDGLMGLTGVTKAFGDALSYLRLFALGLASAQLAIVFNQLAADVSQVKGIGLLLGLLVFLFGHALNLLLAVVGGVVHGLRLNCIEFFSWSLTDEGQPFETFRTKAEK